MKTDFMSSIELLCREKSLDKDTLIQAIETAVVAALKRKYSQDAVISFNIDEHSGQFDVRFVKRVVERLRDRSLEITLADAHKIAPEAQVGEDIEVPVNIDSIARITAQTTKQIILQRVREVEKNQMYDAYSERIGELVLSPVDRLETRRVVLNLGDCDGYLTQRDFLPHEEFRVGEMVKAVIRDVEFSRKGGIRVYMSRTNEDFLLRLFEEEVPEVASRNVLIKAAAREAGSRSKIAVYSMREGMDPIGACVGVKGSRVGAVVDEIGGEKIDIIHWSDEPAIFICNALSPARVIKMDIYDEDRMAIVVVPEDQLSLAIGKHGQNVRLAARLTNWKIDIFSEEEYADRMAEDEQLADEPVNEIEAADDIDHGPAEDEIDMTEEPAGER